MNKFNVPTVEYIFIDKSDVISTSNCGIYCTQVDCNIVCRPQCYNVCKGDCTLVGQ